MNHPAPDTPHCLPTRRQWLQRAGAGFGMIGLAGLLQDEGLLRAADVAKPETPTLDPMAPRPAHFPGRAKRVIWMFINGGPSQVDTWEYKPGLEKWHGKSMREFDPEFKDTTGFFAIARPFANALELAIQILPSRYSCQTGEDATSPLGVVQLKMPTSGWARNRSISLRGIGWFVCGWSVAIDSPLRSPQDLTDELGLDLGIGVLATVDCLQEPPGLAHHRRVRPD